MKDGHLIGVAQNSLEGFICKGDSGGGIIYFVDNKPKIIGVMSSTIYLNSDGVNRAGQRP